MMFERNYLPVCYSNSRDTWFVIVYNLFVDDDEKHFLRPFNRNVRPYPPPSSYEWVEEQKARRILNFVINYPKHEISCCNTMNKISRSDITEFNLLKIDFVNDTNFLTQNKQERIITV